MRYFPLSHRLPLYVATVVVTQLSAFSQDFQWNGGAGSWSSEENWSPAAPFGGPDGAGLEVALTGPVTGNQTVTLDGNRTIGHLTLGATSGSGRFFLAPGSGGSLTFAAADRASVRQIATSNGETISAGVLLETALDLYNDSERELKFTGNISSGAVGTQTVVHHSGALTLEGKLADGTSGGKLAIEKWGSGTLRLDGQNTFTGGLTLHEGTVRLGSGTALGGSDNRVTINGGDLYVVAATTLANAYDFRWNGDFTLSGVNLNFGTGSVLLGADVMVHSTSTALRTHRIGGAIGDDGAGHGLTFSGNAAFHLTGANSYEGATTAVDGARIHLSGEGSALSSSEFRLRQGELHLNNSGTTVIPRVAADATVRMEAGHLQLYSNTTTGYTQALDAVVLAGGGNTVYLSQPAAGGQRITLELNKLEREMQAVAMLRGTNIGSNSMVTVEQAPKLIGGDGSAANAAIIPYLIGESNINNGNPGTQFVTASFDAGSNAYVLRTMGGADYHSFTGDSSSLPPLADFSQLESDTNVRVNATLLSEPVQLAGGVINSLILHQQSPTGAPAGEAEFNLSGTATIQSGALLFSRVGATPYRTVLAGGTLQFAAENSATSSKEGVITVTTAGEVVIASRISGSGGVTLSTYNAGSMITLASDANDYSGVTTVNGVVNVGADGAIPAHSRVHVAEGGELNIRDHAASAGSLSGSGVVNLALSTGGTLTVGADASDSRFEGRLQGEGGSLVKVGAGAQTLAGQLDYTGTTVVSEGALLVDGHHAQAGSYLVESSAMLGGSGRIAFTEGSGLLVDGTLGGGLAVELEVDSEIRFGSEGRINFTLGDALGSSPIRLEGDGKIVFSDTAIDFTLSAVGELELGSYLLFSAEDASFYDGLTLTPQGVIASGLWIGAGLSSYESRLELTGGELTLHIINTIPEPKTSATMALGAVIVGWWRWQRRRKKGND